MSETPDAVVMLYPKVCAYCGSGEMEPTGAWEQQRQEVDIPEVRPRVVEYRQGIGICRHCRKRSTGEFPRGIAASVQIGPRSQGWMSYLKVAHHLSYQRVARLFKELLSLPVSMGTVHAKVSRTSEDCRAEYERIREALKKEDVLLSDEAGNRVNGNNEYTWFFGSRRYACFVSSPSRGFKVIEETLGDSHSGVWVSDRHGAQLKVKAKHQVCLVHVIRNCNYPIEAEGSQWARSLKETLQAAIHLRKSKGEAFDPLAVETLVEITRIQAKVHDLLSKPPPKPEERKLFNGLVGHWERLLLFLEDSRVPYDNNDSERALRHCVVNRKVTGGFRTSKGARQSDVLASILETAKRQGKKLLDALTGKISLAPSS